MSLIRNVMNSCGFDNVDDAREELASSVANAAENYVYDTIVHGASDFKALSNAVDEVLSDLGIERDYEFAVANMISSYLMEHPEVEDNAREFKREQEEEDAWREELAEHMKHGEVWALAHAERWQYVPGPVPSILTNDLEECFTWAKMDDCVNIGGGMTPYVLRSEMVRLGYLREEEREEVLA